MFACCLNWNCAPEEALPTPEAQAAVESQRGPALPFLDEDSRRVMLRDLDPIPKTRHQRHYERSDKTLALLKVAHEVKAPGGDISNPCIAWAGLQCTQTALDAYYKRLDDVERRAGRPGKDATVVTLGNSLIASDRVTNIMRNRLAERFGDGGKGWLLAERPAPYGGRERTGHAFDEDNWTPFNFSMGPRGPAPFGLPGVHHISTKTGTRTTWFISGHQSGRLYWLDHPGSPAFDLHIDGQRYKHINVSAMKASGKNLAKASYRLRFANVKLPPGAKRLTLIARGKGLVVQGVLVDKAQAGSTFDQFGIVAADSSTWLRAEASVFRAELAAVDPGLVIVMLGGNEVRRIAWGKSSVKKIRRDMTRLIERTKQAAPTSSCLVAGPLHAIYDKRDQKKMFRTRSQLDLVNATYREVARAEGCAFFDFYHAMGGRGTMRRLWDHHPRLLHDDLVHPRGKGLDFLGELLVDALLRDWVKTPPPQDKAREHERWRRLAVNAILPVAPGTSLQGAASPDAFGHFAQALKTLKPEQLLVVRSAQVANRQLANGQLANGQRARIALMGGREQFSSAFAKRLRSRLTRRFGDGGRGLLDFGVSEESLRDQTAGRQTAGAQKGVLRMAAGTTVTLQLPSSSEENQLRVVKYMNRGRARRPHANVDVLWMDTQLYPAPPQAVVASRPKASHPEKGVPPGMAPGIAPDMALSSLLAFQHLQQRAGSKEINLTVPPALPHADALQTQPALLAVSHERSVSGVVLDDLSTSSLGARFQFSSATPGVPLASLAALREQRDWAMVLLAPNLQELTASQGPSALARVAHALGLGTNDPSCVVLEPLALLSLPSADANAASRQAADIAGENGCSYFSTLAVLGGQKGAKEWSTLGLFDPTKNVLTPKGGRALADLLLAEIMAHFERLPVVVARSL